jgi:exodeoxyribonuclease-5
MELSIDQRKALDTLMGWSKKMGENQFLTLGGYAGTGKTTLISVYRKKIREENKKIRVAFASFTGKATRVLRGKLAEMETVYKEDSIGTIHSLIYSPIVDTKKNIVGWKKKDEIEADLIVIDEGSMVDGVIWGDLVSYGLPIVVVGDHGQLPPIRGDFNLMERPMVKLEKIHRQAEKNPIIKVSMLAREEGKIPFEKFGDGVEKMNKKEADCQERIEELLGNFTTDLLVLCGYNNTRVKLNKFIREGMQFESAEPAVNDRVICLRNNHKVGIYNGMLGVIEALKSKDDQWFRTEIKMDGEQDNYEGLILKSQFNSQEAMNFSKNRYLTIKGDLFDFGYALTVHKAQGSQAKKVVLFEERFSQMDENMWRRWLYTAVTRAEEELFIVG